MIAGENKPNRIPITFSAELEQRLEVIQDVMGAARAAQQEWRALHVHQRLRVLRRTRQLMAENASALAEASGATRGRPATEVMTCEVLPLLEACRFLEKKATAALSPRKLGGRGKPAWLFGTQSVVVREPFGVVLVIGPANYPLFLPGVQALQALAAGNAVLLKPGVNSSRPVHLLRKLLLSAGLDPRLLFILPEPKEFVSTVLSTSPDKVIFTGSASVGQNVLAQCSRRLVPATMELSGNDALIVRADADLNLVVQAVAFASKLNDGATCIAPKRIVVHASRATELEGKLAKELAEVPRRHWPAEDDSGSRLRGKWPLLLIEDALKQGSHFISGGFGPDGKLQVPAVLGGVSHNAALLSEDVFASVVSLLTVADDTEAVAVANSSAYGLGASIFSADQNAARAMAAQLNAGVVSINDLIVPTADPRVPFGGRGRSGFGVTRGEEGLLEMTRPKVITLTRGTFRPAFQKPNAEDLQLFATYASLAHATCTSSRITNFFHFARLLFRRVRNQPST